MADYIDENVINDIQFSGSEDQHVPLINDFVVDTSHLSCKYNSTGFINASDVQSLKARRQLIMATSLCFIFMVTELIGGYYAGSLAIMADAAHLLSDCVSFIVALIAISWARKPADDRMSFGYKRLEVLGAVLSILGIWLLTACLFYLAVERLVSYNFDIDANTMMIVSVIGVAINIVMAFILHGSCHHSHSLHSHSHSHSHSPKPAKHKYAPLSNEIYQSNDDMFIRNPNNNSIASQNVNGSSILLSRSDSVCSHRSPSHSRTNSFSKKITSHDGRRTSIPSAILQMKLTESVNHRASFDGTCDRNASVHKHINSQNEEKADCDHASGIDEASDFSKKNINIQAAVIHVLGDFIQSIGVFVAALFIKFYPNWKIADPICTFVFSIIVILTTIRIMKESISILLDAVPAGINFTDLAAELCRIDGVCSVHHLNVWSISTSHHAMSAHVVIDMHANTDDVLHSASKLVNRKFGIKNSTIQVERQSDLHSTHNVLESVINFV